MLQEFIVLVLFHVVALGLLYPTKKTATVTPIAKVDYFPTEPLEEVKPEPVVTVAPAPVTTAKPKAKATIAALIKEEVSRQAIAVQPVKPANDLSTMSIRSLYALAKGKVKNYKKLSRAQLIQNLQALA